LVPNPIDSLTVIAEISLGLVGLTAIVTVLRRPDGDLDRLDRIRSLHLLVYAGVTLLLALLPSLLTAMDFEPTRTWRVSSGVMIVCSFIGFATNPRPWARSSFRSSQSILLVFIYLFASANVLLQMANAAGAFGLPRYWPYLLGLLWYLAFCLTQFAALLFLRPTE
jgi:hypothetical protein